MAISTLAYKITADTAGFTKNVQASRKELNLAKRVMQETETPASKLEKSLKSLEAVHRKGLISSQQYAAAQSKVKMELGQTDAKVGPLRAKMNALGKSFTNFKGIASGILGPLGLAVGGFAGISKAIGAITQQLEDLDRLGKTGAKLGIAPTDLRAFEFAAQKAGIGAGQLEKGLGAMLDKLGGAQRGTDTEAIKAFKDLNLNAKEFIGLDPSLAFVKVADAISKMDNQQQKLNAASDIFGAKNKDFVRLLDLGAVGLAKNREEVARLVGELDTEAVEKFNDDLARLGLLAEGTAGGAAEALAGSEVGAGAALLGRFGIGGRGVARTVGTTVIGQATRAAGGAGVANIGEVLKLIERNTRTPIVNEETNL